MTSQNVEIQTLISGIDEVLSKNAPRLPWVMSQDALQQRQVLEQARQYLTSLQEAEANQRLPSASPASLQASSLPLGQAAGQAVSQASGQASAESAQQVLQSVLQEMNYWRVNMLQPLRTEIDALQRQRELLSQEVRQLEGRQQALSGASSLQNQQLMEFLQAAMGQMQANLSAQVTQMIANLPEQSSLAPDIQLGQVALPAADRQIAQTQLMQTQSDQLMLKLDSTLQIIFESLNRNVQVYQESMEQGLGRMHHLGQQGEAMFTFLVNRLAQQLGREATSFLQSGADAPSQVLSPANQAQGAASLGSIRAAGGSDSPASPVPASPFKVADFLSQVPEPRSTGSFVPAVPFNLSEEVLDIADLDAAECSPDALLSSSLGAELNQLQLEAVPEPALNMLESVEPFDLFSGTLPLAASSPALPDGPIESALISSDLDSALDLLNQLSAEMQAESAIGAIDERYGDSDLVADLAADLAAAPALLPEPALIATPDLLYDDAFYSSSFQESAASSAPASDLTDSMTLEQAWFDGLGDPAFQPVSQPVTQPNPVLVPASSTRPETAAETALPQPPDAKSDFEQTLQTLIQANAFETMPVSEAPNEAADDDLGMTLDSLTQLGSPVESRVTSANPPVVTIEGLEGLFADLPDLGSGEAAKSQAEVITDLFSQVGAVDPLTKTAIDPASETLEKKNL